MLILWSLNSNLYVSVLNACNPVLWAQDQLYEVSYTCMSILLASSKAHLLITKSLSIYAPMFNIYHHILLTPDETNCMIHMSMLLPCYELSLLHGIFFLVIGRTLLRPHACINLLLGLLACGICIYMPRFLFESIGLYMNTQWNRGMWILLIYMYSDSHLHASIYILSEPRIHAYVYHEASKFSSIWP